MKTCAFLITCLIGICINTCGQNFNEIMLVNRIPIEIAGNEKLDVTSGTDFISTQKIKNPGHLSTPYYEQVYYFLKSTDQQLNSLALLTRGSPSSFLGAISRCYMTDNNCYTGNLSHTNKTTYINCTRLTLTGLVMMGRNISYLINSLKTKNAAGLNLTCQKTSFGACNKAYKKVTSLTFSISLGK